MKNNSEWPSKDGHLVYNEAYFMKLCVFDIFIQKICLINT